MYYSDFRVKVDSNFLSCGKWNVKLYCLRYTVRSMNPAGLDQMLIPVIVFRDILARMHLQANCYAPDVIVHEVDTQIFIYVN